MRLTGCAIRCIIAYTVVPDNYGPVSAGVIVTRSIRLLLDGYMDVFVHRFHHPVVSLCPGCLFGRCCLARFSYRWQIGRPWWSVGCKNNIRRGVSVAAADEINSTAGLCMSLLRAKHAVNDWKDYKIQDIAGEEKGRIQSCILMNYPAIENSPSGHRGLFRICRWTVHRVGYDFLDSNSRLPKRRIL